MTMANDAEDIVHAQREAAFLALSAALKQSGSSAVAVFIDPSLIDPLRDDLCDTDAVACRALRELQGYFAPDRLPYLALVKDAQRSWRLLDRCVEQAVREARDMVGDDQHPRSVCGWIVAPDDLLTLAHTLGVAARVVRPEKEVWPLRYWDPRVIWHLPRTLSRAQYAALRPRLGNWWHLDNNVQMAPAAAAESEEPALLPLRFDAKGWRALERIGKINELMPLAAGWGYASGPELARRIDDAMQRAEGRGFGSDGDLQAFATCALIGHARFDDHPRVADAITRAKTAGEDFTAAVAGFDEEFWASLNDGRWLEQLPQGGR